MENNKLNIVVIGCSKMGQRHMKGVYEQDGAVLYGVCDIHDDVLFEARDKFDVPHTTNDYMDFVNDPAVDAAVIVVPDPLHMEMSVAFMRAGKDVLCEKPMTLRVEECAEMIRVEKETGRKLMIGQVCHYAPAFRKAKDLIDAGQIGELFFVESEYAHNYEKAHCTTTSSTTQKCLSYHISTAINSRRATIKYNKFHKYISFQCFNL